MCSRPANLVTCSSSPFYCLLAVCLFLAGLKLLVGGVVSQEKGVVLNLGGDKKR